MLNDVKWVQACRDATDWREALAIAIEPLIRHGAAQAAYLNGVIENTLAWGLTMWWHRGSLYPTPGLSRAQCITRLP